jgi:osmoprotectant transport system permease protein
MLSLIAVAILLALLVAGMPALAPLFHAAFPDVVPPIYGFLSFPELLLAHAEIAAEASLAAIAAALALGVLATREAGHAFRPIVGAAAAIGQTFPPVAVLAVAVPVLGYGEGPTFLALAIYGFLPVVANVIAGIETVPPLVKEAAQGMGYAPWRILADPYVIQGAAVVGLFAILADQALERVERRLRRWRTNA